MLLYSSPTYFLETPEALEEIKSDPLQKISKFLVDFLEHCGPRFKIWLSSNIRGLCFLWMIDVSKMCIAYLNDYKKHCSEHVLLAGDAGDAGDDEREAPTSAS
jgi:hypothetical protein